MSETTGWTFDVPGGWVRLPAGAQGGDELLDQFVAMWQLDDDARGRLRAALSTVDAVAAARTNRAHWGFVPDPGSGRVEGLMSVHMLRVVNGGISHYRDMAAIPVDQSATVMHRTVKDEAFNVGPGVSVHDFVVDPPRGGIPDPGVERALVAVFPDGSEVAYEFALITQNLAAFPDIVEYLSAIARTMRVAEAAA